MKYLFIILSLSLLLTSCGGDDDSNSNPPVESNDDYFPIAESNTWYYEGSNIDTPVDTAYIMGTSVVEGNTFYNLYNQRPIFGFEGDSKVRKNGSNYYVSGAFQFADLPAVPIVNQLFMQEDASDGDIINDDVFTVSMDPTTISDGGVSAVVTPHINLHVVIEQMESLDTLTSGGIAYEDGIKTQWTFYLSTYLEFSDTGIVNIGDHTLIPEEQIGTLNQVYVNNVGVVYSAFNLDFSNLSFNTDVVTPAGTIDIEPYIGEVMAYFENANHTNYSHLIDYELN